jgi:hypothetical protein
MEQEPLNGFSFDFLYESYVKMHRHISVLVRVGKNIGYFAKTCTCSAAHISSNVYWNETCFEKEKCRDK